MATVEGCQDHVGSQHNPNEDSDDLESHESTNGSDQEGQPLLHEPGQEDWRPPPAFVAIQIAIMSNVFLYGFDSTITASTYAVISSEFDAANTASWLTTSYLVTSTAFQPLYGRVSDIFGRRICFFISTITFALGCLGCGIARNVVFLNIMRALTGFGGGGLMTMGQSINLSRHARLREAELTCGFSNHCELRYHPISSEGYVSSHAEWNRRVWHDSGGFLRRHHC